MEKNPTSAVHFRTKLLSAVCQMQSALCIQDLGQLYHKPLRDSLGTVVLSCISNVKVSLEYFFKYIEYSLMWIAEFQKCVSLKFSLDTVEQNSKETYRNTRGQQHQRNFT